MSTLDRNLWDRLPNEKPAVFWSDLEDARYPFVDTGQWVWDDSWAKMLAWCQSEIGEERYTWIGDRFWFLDTDDATRFALVWT